MNSYKYAEDSEKARLEGIKEIDELLELSKNTEIVTGVAYRNTLERLKKILEVEG